MATPRLAKNAESQSPAEPMLTPRIEILHGFLITDAEAQQNIETLKTITTKQAGKITEIQSYVENKDNFAVPINKLWDQ